MELATSIIPRVDTQDTRNTRLFLRGRWKRLSHNDLRAVVQTALDTMQCTTKFRWNTEENCFVLGTTYYTLSATMGVADILLHVGGKRKRRNFGQHHGVPV